MKRTLLLVVVFASISLFAFAQEKKAANPVEQAVLKLEQQWEDALVKSDVAALEKLYDDTMVYTHSSGSVDNKSAYINAIKSGATKYQSMKRDDIKVNVYGNAAVVTCHWEVHVLARGNKIDTNARYIHVYVKRKDGWKMVAHQATRITQ
jgi:ketosteroid isomerase-like protein